MLKKYLVLLLAALMTCLCLTAWADAELPAEIEVIEDGAFEGDTSLTGLITLSDTIRSVGERAFASTNLYALYVPFYCESVGADVLAGSGATYLYIDGYDTVFDSSVANGVDYVFANPYNDAAWELPNFVSSYDLYYYDGVYYRYNDDDTMHALCPDDPADLYSSTLTIPKTIFGMPVTSASGLKLSNCDTVTTVKVPSYLDLPSIPGKTVVSYDVMTVTAPLSSVALEVGTAASFSVDVFDAYGDLTFKWTFTNGTDVTEATTTEPSVTTTPTDEDFTIAVEVTDALGDKASASVTYSLAFDESVKYRALLIGNTYPGTSAALDGPDNDVYAMQKLLSMWPRTPYSTTTRINVTTNDMVSSVASAFAGADSNDVSLFFYSGHGTPYGDLCGTSDTFLSVSELRDCLDRIPGTKIVMLDCCYSGAHINKGEEASAAAFNNAVIMAFSAKPKGDLATDGYIVLTASSKDQISNSYTYDMEFWFGAFTYSVCYGSGYDMINAENCTVWADSNSDAQVTLYECYSDAVDTIKNTFRCEQNIQYYGPSDYILWRK